MTTKRTYKGRDITALSPDELVQALADAIDALEALKAQRTTKDRARLDAEVKRLAKQVRKL